MQNSLYFLIQKTKVDRMVSEIRGNRAMKEDHHTNLSIEVLSREDPEQITISQAEKKLNKPCAFWLLSSKGDIIAANILAIWLWEARQLNSSTFFGVNIFEIFNQQRTRIPKDKNEEFFRKKILVLNRLIRGFGRRPYKNFLKYLNTYPDLKEMLDKKMYIPDKRWESERIWEYSLRIVPPKETYDADLLEFHVTVYRLYPNNEFLAVYEPHPRSEITQSILYEKFNEAKNASDIIEYVQYRNGIRRGEKLVIPVKAMNPFEFDQSVVEKALVTIADIRVRQLEALALKDPPWVVAEDLRKELEAIKQENVGRKKTYEGTSSSRGSEPR